MKKAIWTGGLGCIGTSLLLVIILVASVLLFGRSLTIERGFSLESHMDNGFVFDAWSYGNWHELRDGGVLVSTYEPPYDLLLAIRPGNHKCETVEIVSAMIRTKDGKRADATRLLADKVDRVQRRSSAAIAEPYAVFHFRHALRTHDTFTIELEFNTLSKGRQETFRSELTIPGFEKRSHGLVFWDVMMGV